MRILQVVHGFPPNEWAGTELVTLHLSQALRTRGHDVTVLARVHDPQRADGTICETSYDNLPVFQLVNNYTTNSTFRSSYDNPLFNQPFLRVLDRVRPEVVHFQHTQHLSVSLLRLAPALGYPTVLSLHDFFFACQRIQLIDAQQQLCPGPDHGERCVPCLQGVTGSEEARRRFLEMQRVLYAPDVVLTPSVFLAQKMQTYFPSLKDKLRTVPLGVDPPVGEYGQRSARLPDAPLRLLYVGVLAPHKGAHMLLEALKGLPSDRIEVSLYGAEWSQWQTYLDQLHAAAETLPVKFCGAYTHDDLGAILRQHDVLVMPMIWEETFSIVTREALFAGVPVVAARLGALPEVVQDNVNGLLFEPENATDLRHCLLRLIQERGLLEQLRVAHTPVKTVAEYAAEVEDVYQEVLRMRFPQEKDKQNNMTLKEEAVSLNDGVRETAAKVSVCIPTYNGSAFLAESITSVLSQSFRDFELLIVDDCSIDTTLDIVHSFADSRIVVHQNERRLGIPGNWNQCLALASGEYVCIFHQDDMMLPENLSRKVQLLESARDIVLVHSAVEPLIEAQAPVFSSDWLEQAEQDFVVEGLQYFRKLLLYGNCICAPAVMTRRQLLRDLGGFDEALHFTPDYAMWMHLCMRGRIAFIHQPLLGYRWHAQNASHDFRFERGLEETLTAAEKALHNYVERTGRVAEGKILRETLGAVTKSRRWMVELDRSKEWLEDQWQNWQRLAQEREKVIQEQQAWIAELEKGKAWLEDQWKNWQEIAEERARVLQEYESRIDALTGDMEKQQQHFQSQERALQEQWQALQKQRWIRLGVQLKTLKPFNLQLPRKDQEPLA